MYKIAYYLMDNDIQMALRRYNVTEATDPWRSQEPPRSLAGFKINK